MSSLKERIVEKHLVYEKESGIMEIPSKKAFMKWNPEIFGDEYIGPGRKEEDEHEKRIAEAAEIKRVNEELAFRRIAEIEARKRKAEEKKQMKNTVSGLLLNMKKKMGLGKKIVS